MKLKHAILVQMDRDTLKSIIDDLGHDGVDRRSARDMKATLSRAHRAIADMLLEYLGEKQVKSVCEMMGISRRGRRRSLITCSWSSARYAAERLRHRGLLSLHFPHFAALRGDDGYVRNRSNNRVSHR